MKPNFDRHFMVLFAVLAAVRLLVLIFPSHLLFAESSEIFRGVLTKEIVSGSRAMPFFEYQYNPYYGGSIITSFLAVPFFVLFGASLFALKLTTVVYAVLTFYFLYKIADRYFNKSAAFFAVLLFIFSPQYFLQRSQIAYGDYCESAFFTLAGMYIFLAMTPRLLALNDKQDAANPFIYVLFGLVSGFSLWFNYIYMIALLPCLIIWVSLDRKLFLRKSFLFFLSGFLLGFSPWLYYNFTRGFQGVVAGRAPIVSHFLSRDVLFSLHRLHGVLMADIPNALMAENTFIPERGVFIFSRAYYAVCAASFIGLCFLSAKDVKAVAAGFFNRQNNPPLQPGGIAKLLLALYPVFFIVVYSFCHIPTTVVGVGFHDYRRIFPLFVFIYLVIGYFLSLIFSLRRNGPSLGAAVLLFFLVSYGISGMVPMLSCQNFAAGLRMEGYSYRLLGSNISESSQRDISRWFEAIRAAPRDYWPEVCLGFGQGLGEDIGDDIAPHEVRHYLEMAEGLESECLQNLYLGLGKGTASSVYENGIDYREVAGVVDERYLGDFKRGFGSIGGAGQT